MTRTASDPITQARLDDLALGKVNPKTGKRERGFIVAARKMRQNQEKLAAGLMDESDLIEAAYNQAWAHLDRASLRAGEGSVTEADGEDATYAAEQEERYRTEYEWDDANANDDAGLLMLISLEIESRRIKRDLARPGIPWKEKTELLGELRGLATTHAGLQKSLGIDKTTRAAKRNTADPMQAFHDVLDAGDAKLAQVLEEWPARSAEAETLEQLRALISYSTGFPYAWVDATIAALRRHLRCERCGEAFDGDSAPSESTAVEAE